MTDLLGPCHHCHESRKKNSETQMAFVTNVTNRLNQRRTNELIRDNRFVTILSRMSRIHFERQ